MSSSHRQYINGRISHNEVDKIAYRCKDGYLITLDTNEQLFLYAAYLHYPRGKLGQAAKLITQEIDHLQNHLSGEVLKQIVMYIKAQNLIATSTQRSSHYLSSHWVRIVQPNPDITDIVRERAFEAQEEDTGRKDGTSKSAPQKGARKSADKRRNDGTSKSALQTDAREPVQERQSTEEAYDQQQQESGGSSGQPKFYPAYEPLPDGFLHRQWYA